ncbi:MAG TPA: translation initiation factor IF-1 [Verrucomicrobiae bacterium]|nr:translation initiation factor IF-1 [Verrucomicrobiae bacterium]
MSRDRIRLEGKVVELVPGTKVCRVELANGHRMLGFVAGKNAGSARFAIGDQVTLEVSPFDFSKGRIVKPG